jgi:hypothetical protein
MMISALVQHDFEYIPTNAAPFLMTFALDYPTRNHQDMLDLLLGQMTSSTCHYRRLPRSTTPALLPLEETKATFVDSLSFLVLVAFTALGWAGGPCHQV